MGRAVQRDLVFFHGLQQRALRLGCASVDLVGQQDLGEDRAGMEMEAPRFLVKDRLKHVRY